MHGNGRKLNARFERHLRQQREHLKREEESARKWSEERPWVCPSCGRVWNKNGEGLPNECECGQRPKGVRP